MWWGHPLQQWKRNEESDIEEKEADVKQLSNGEKGCEVRQKYEDHEGN